MLEYEVRSVAVAGKSASGFVEPIEVQATVAYLQRNAMTLPADPEERQFFGRDGLFRSSLEAQRLDIEACQALDVDGRQAKRLDSLQREIHSRTEPRTWV